MTETATDRSPPDVTDAPAPCRWAVLGLGRTGLAYAMALARQPGCALAGLVESRTELRRFARGAGFAQPSTATLERLLAKTPVDAVAVCAPVGDRVALIEAALAAKLAVLVHGLPAPDAAGASRVARALEAAGTPVACGSDALFHPLLARAGRLLARGALGPLRRVRASVFVSRVFAPGVAPARGDVLDFAVGDLLLLLDRLFGPARSVKATAHRLYGERIDELHAMLALADGLEVGVDGSWSVPGYPRAAYVVEADGERGSMLVSDDALEVDLAVPCDGLPAGASRRVLADEADPLPFDAGEPSRIVSAFARVLAGGDEPALDPRRALRVVRLAGAIRASVEADGAERETAP